MIKLIVLPHVYELKTFLFIFLRSFLIKKECLGNMWYIRACGNKYDFVRKKYVPTNVKYLQQSVIIKVDDIIYNSKCLS